jgi:hypothetical protein
MGRALQRQRVQTCRHIAPQKRRLWLGSADALRLSRTTTTAKVPHRSLHRSIKDERTVTTACPQPGTENGLQRPTDLKGQTRAKLIMARRADLHQKAEYICADLSSRPNFPLQSCGGQYILGTCLSSMSALAIYHQLNRASENAVPAQFPRNFRKPRFPGTSSAVMARSEISKTVIEYGSGKTAYSP